MSTTPDHPRQRTVKTPAFRVIGGGRHDASSVTLVPNGRMYDECDVLLDGEKIGVVLRGERTSSPPTHRGSRIAKYHRRIPEWRARSVDGRKYMLCFLLACHAGEDRAHDVSYL